MVSQSPDGVREVVEYGIWLAGVKSGGIKDPPGAAADAVQFAVRQRAQRGRDRSPNCHEERPAL